jgi:tetratricopeptide (TPR) repeat protein
MSWIGWLIIAAVLFCVPLYAVRGAIELWHWYLDNFTDPTTRRRAPPRRERIPVERDSRSDSGTRTSRIPMGEKVASRFHPLAPFTHLARKLVAGKRFDYWVGCALEESNPAKKVQYCTRAIELNPTYVPAWGLKGTTLLDMQRYAEAIESFDQVLKLAPSPLAWYRKGLCLYHLKQFDDAVQCFNKTLATCSNTDRALVADAERHKLLAQEGLQARGAEGRV